MTDKESINKEFSPQDLVDDVRVYQQIDEERLYSKISFLLKKWVNSGMLQEHLDTFSMI